MTFTAQYKEALARYVPLFLLDIQKDADGPDLEFGVMEGQRAEWITETAYNRVSRLFVLSMMNNDDERYVLFTRASPIAALKWVGNMPYKPDHAYNADASTLVPLADDDFVMAVVKKFSLSD